MLGEPMNLIITIVMAAFFVAVALAVLAVVDILRPASSPVLASRRRHVREHARRRAAFAPAVKLLRRIVAFRAKSSDR